ncbi:restriction endonuclease subunit S [Thiolapillus sp.]|uniref:restriction endonuclease subunit S n=2 Tax=Thiolapillus sp. TaxID=2017437 RepID=UPI0025E87058|nr:restriction endonuclease subunit S [Thiolapillus sp.]
MKLNEIASINAGHQFRGRIQEKPGTGMFAVQMKNISPNQTVNWISCSETEPAGKREPNWLKPGDVLFAARGNNNYAVLIDETIGGLRAVAAPHFFVLRSKTRQLRPGFLAWLLNRPPSQHYFQREAEGTLTKSIRRSVLGATPVVLPPLDKQDTIINLANAINKKQQLMEQLVRNGETLMNGIANDLLQKPGVNAQ